MAGPRPAFVEIPLTVFSNESWRARARVTAYTVHTLSSIPTARLPGARLGRTVIHINFTLEPYKAKNRKISLYVSSKVINFFKIVFHVLLILFLDTLLRYPFRVIILSINHFNHEIHM